MWPLITGAVPELKEWTGNNRELIFYIHSELRDAFLYIKAHQGTETRKELLEQSYVFFKSQEIDRAKDLSLGSLFSCNGCFRRDGTKHYLSQVFSELYSEPGLLTVSYIIDHWCT